MTLVVEGIEGHVHHHGREQVRGLNCCGLDINRQTPQLRISGVGEALHQCTLLEILKLAHLRLRIQQAIRGLDARPLVLWSGLWAKPSEMAQPVPRANLSHRPLASRTEWFQNGSMNITLKSVPQAVYRVIKREAREQGRSLNAQIIQTLQNEAAEVERRRALGQVRKQLERFAASLRPLGDSAPLIRQDRQR